VGTTGRGVRGGGGIATAACGTRAAGAGATACVEGVAAGVGAGAGSAIGTGVGSGAVSTGADGELMVDAESPGTSGFTGRPTGAACKAGKRVTAAINSNRRRDELKIAPPETPKRRKYKGDAWMRPRARQASGRTR